MATKTLDRQIFRTSRELEYFTEKELTLQTGHSRERWHLVIVKELVDNALDECEGAGILPEVKVEVGADEICVSDNGTGLGREVIQDIIDYRVRVSSKDAYISPTRGAQGNALKTILAIPYVLNESKHSTVEISSKGECHTIDVGLDRIAQSPRIDLETNVDGVVKNGTRVKVKMPKWACSKMDAQLDFLQLIGDFALFNPHATFDLQNTTKTVRFEPTSTTCDKWLANAPTSAHWYGVEQLRNLIAACVSAEESRGPVRTVREFIAEFRGLSSTGKQKAILERLKLASVPLHDLIEDGDIDREAVGTLLTAMQAQSKPIAPTQLGVLGEAHFRAQLEQRGMHVGKLKYKRIAGVDDKTNLPFVLELAFGVHSDNRVREVITGLNWSPTLMNPFRQLTPNGIGLDALLDSLDVSASDPVTFIVHLACPHLGFTDRGKSSLEAL